MTPEYYNKTYKGIKLDPYRIAEVYDITDHAIFQALKKLLAAGQRGGKDIRQDLTEARDAISRKLEMIVEDAIPPDVAPVSQVPKSPVIWGTAG